MSETTVSQKSSRYYSRPHTKEEKKKQKRERQKKIKKEIRLKKKEARQHKRIKLDGPLELHGEFEEGPLTNRQEKPIAVPPLCPNVDESNGNNDLQQGELDGPNTSAQATITTCSNKHTKKDDASSESISKVESKLENRSRGKQMAALAKKIGGSSTLEASFIKPSSCSYLARQYRPSYDKRLRNDNSVNMPVREVDYQLISKFSDIPVGDGSFGTCYLAEYRNIKVAVKEMKNRNSSLIEKERCRKEVLHESKVLHALGDHPNLPLLLGICSVKEPYCLVLQFHGTERESLTLDKAIHKKLLKKTQIIQVFLGICRVLQYVHRNGYLHNDIKSNNVLLQPLGESYQPILIDFGKSKLIEQGEKRFRSKVSASYLAPEVVQGHRETIASDIFSFGKMLQLAVSRRSFKEAFENLVSKITSDVPNERPTTEEIKVSLDNLTE